MAECSTCGEQTSMPFTCKFCEQSYCSAHRLPENHDCNGLEEYKEQSHEEGKIGYTVNSREQEVEVEERGRRRRNKNLIPSLDRFMPGNLPVTYILLGVLVGVFLLQESIPWFSQLFDLNASAVLYEFEVWRIFTSMFLHANTFHLVVNSIVLFSFGTAAERMLGRKRFLTMLIAAGLASSIGFTLTAPIMDAELAVGFSGALYGMVTLLAVIRPDIRVLLFFIIPLSIRTALAFIVVLDTVNVITQLAGFPIPGISMFASTGHLSGFLAGLFFAHRWKDQFKRSSQRVMQVGTRLHRPGRRF